MVVACSSTRFSSSAMRRSFASSLSAALARDARSLHLDFEQNSLLGPRRFEADSALQFLQRQPAGAAPSAAPSSTVVHSSIEPERGGSCFLGSSVVGVWWTWGRTWGWTQVQRSWKIYLRLPGSNN